jgi:hypothetical protein
MANAFDKALEAVTCAPRVVVTLREEHWASTFNDKPVCALAVGLRLLSIEDKEIIYQAANKAAIDAVGNDSDPSIAGHYAMLITTVSRAICHPKDATRGHEFFGCPDDMIPIALTEKTVKWLFDEIERLTVTISPVFSEATDDEIAEICDVLKSDALTKLESADPVRAKRVRRYLDFIATTELE